MGEGTVDELDEIDPHEAEDKDAHARRRNGHRRPGGTDRPGREMYFRLGLRQAQLEPPGLLGFENTRPHPFARQLRRNRHPRMSSNKKLSTLSKFIWGMPPSAALMIRGGWNTGNSVKRSPQNPVGGGVTGTMPGKNRIRRSP